jgi:hypothetical protein
METSSRRETADAVRAILHEAKALAARYFVLTGKPLGVTGEVAELEAAEKLHLVLTVARNPDYDALRNDESGVVERFQIKGRAVDRSTDIVAEYPPSNTTAISSGCYSSFSTALPSMHSKSGRLVATTLARDYRLLDRRHAMSVSPWA